MKAPKEVTAAVVKARNRGKATGFYLPGINNADMVGIRRLGCGDQAAETVDQCGETVTAALEKRLCHFPDSRSWQCGYEINEDGSPNTAHT